MKHMKNRPVRRFLVLTAFMVCLTGSFTVGAVTGLAVNPAHAADEPSQFGVFWEAWSLVQKNFVDQTKVDPTAMTYGAIRGMLDALGDKNHTAFFSPEEARQVENSLQGTFEGIGAFVDDRDGRVIITAPIHGSPAESSGVKPGDTIVKVNGENVEGMNVDEVISRIRGPAGTKVVITVLHKEAKKPVDITIQRGKIEIENVTWSRIPETDLAYLQISQFTADTGANLEKALQEIKIASASQPVKGIMLDLRNNPGGYLSEALKVNSEFLDPGKIILYERDAQGRLKTYKSEGPGLARDIPMVVLINEGTASAGEITAGALQENSRAQLIGKTTLGTGTVLAPFTLSDGSLLRIGVTNWLTPQQHLIKDQGVKPDMDVTQDFSVGMVDSFALEGSKLNDVLAKGDKQFNLGLLNLRLLTQ